MKGLSKFQAFVRGCMIGLAMNMPGLVSRSPAQVAGPDTVRTDGSAELDPASSPSVVRVPDAHLSALERTNKRVYERLFGENWDADRSIYVLDDLPTSNGAIVTGASGTGQGFELHAALSDPIDAEIATLPDTIRSAADVLAFEGVIVAGLLRTARAEAPIFGCAVRYADAAGVWASRLVILGEPSMPLPDPVAIAGVAEDDLVITTPFSFVSSTNVLLFERAVPVFVDVDPLTGQMTTDTKGPW